jgi:hypothetical protein
MVVNWYNYASMWVMQVNYALCVPFEISSAFRALA